MSKNVRNSTKKHVARLERERQQSAVIRNFAVGIVAVIVLLVGYGWLDEAVLQKNKPVARVGDETVSVTQFQSRVRLERDSMINQYIQMLQIGQSFGMDVDAQLQPIEERMSDPMVLGLEVLETMINELLYKQEATRRGIDVSTDDVNKDIQGFLQYYPDGTPTPIAPAEIVPLSVSTLSAQQLALVTITPEPTLAPTSTPFPTATPDEAAEPTVEAGPTAIPLPSLTPTPYTYEGYQQSYQEALTYYTGTGMTEADFRFLFESQSYYEALYEIITADVSDTGEEIWARHILFTEASVAAFVREQLLDGKDFSELAIEYSDDPSSETNFGDLGWFGRGVMIPEFEDAAFALEEVGDISEPIESQFGIHIIQLLGRENQPLDEQSYQYAKDIAFQEWIYALREESDVEIYDSWQEIVPTEPDLYQTLTELYGQPVQ